MVSISSEESECNRVYGKHCSYRHSSFYYVDSSFNAFIVLYKSEERACIAYMESTVAIVIVIFIS